MKNTIYIHSIWMKFLKSVLILIIALNFEALKAQPCQDFPFDGQIVNCNSTTLDLEYCYGDNFCFELTSQLYGQGGLISGVMWTFTGTSEALIANPNPLQYQGGKIQTGGNLTISGTYQTPFGPCPFTITINIIVHHPTISISSPIIFAVGSNITLNSTPLNVSPPATYNWLQNSYFVPANANNVEDPVVSPLTSMIYTVTVTDQYGCTATATVELIAQPYAILKKTPEGGYYVLTTDNKMLFKYEGQYSTTGLIYNVYDYNHAIVSANAGLPNYMNSLIVKPGDNRYYFDATALSVGYYTLEVINEKKEKLYLRFKR